MSALASTWVEEPEAENSTNLTNSTPPPSRENPVWPEDSILEDFVQLARGVSESEDAILIGCILPIAAALLARRVFIQFGSRKYPNLYHLIVTKPGLRKSTTINFADYIAKKLLPPSSFVSGASSEQALFKSYLPNPDKLWLEDEGNTILSNWANDAAGKIVAKRMLKLYDCGGWLQNYIRQEAENENSKAQQLIPETSTSLLIGTTWNNCRFNGLETRDGMRRRTCYYIGENFARIIEWPGPIDSKETESLIRRFGKLLKLAGECRLSPEARELWSKIQKRNREDIGAITQIDAASEALDSTLAEEPSRILKRAMIFEVCRWASDYWRKTMNVRVGGDIRDAVKTTIRKLLEAEPEISDTALARKLADRAKVAISHRTVAKYRMALGIRRQGTLKEALAEAISQNPAATDAELAAILSETTRMPVSTRTVATARLSLGIRRNRKRRHRHSDRHELPHLSSRV